LAPPLRGALRFDLRCLRFGARYPLPPRAAAAVSAGRAAAAP